MYVKIKDKEQYKIKERHLLDKIAKSNILYTLRKILLIHVSLPFKKYAIKLFFFVCSSTTFAQQQKKVEVEKKWKKNAKRTQQNNANKINERVKITNIITFLKGLYILLIFNLLQNTKS